MYAFNETAEIVLILVSETGNWFTARAFKSFNRVTLKLYNDEKCLPNRDSGLQKKDIRHKIKELC